MSSTQDSQAEPDTLPESQLDRPHPDSILADEADPNEVLGEETVSDKVTKGLSQDEPLSKRSSALFSNELPEHAGHTEPSTTADASAETVEQLREQVKELRNQVTGLNDKLVKSFNRMADIEDDYSDAQEKVRSTSAKIAELEKERAEHLDALNTGLLVEKRHVSSEMQRMMDRIIEETAQRGKAESDKTKIEAELDELSSSLFSEANKMVAVERLSRARAEEKSRNMEERLKDTEGIMLEQQKVLADLQQQVEKLQVSSRRAADDAETKSIDSDAASFHLLTTSSLARSASQRTTGMQRRHRPIADPSSDLRLMINIVPYQEFKAFILHLRKLRKQLAPFYNYPVEEGNDRSPTPRLTSPTPQRASTPSGSFGQGSSSSPFASAGVSRHRDYPSLPANVENLVQLPSQLSLPFIKRSLEEDVDPCLRLDFAPGLNWLSRRQTNTAILDGNLLIEPLFSGGNTVDGDALRRQYAHLPPAACSMCGIPIVNVPLPGGAAATALSGEQGGKASLAPTSVANATSSWASSAASSLSSITGSSNSTNTLTPKPSRAGLFSSFRKTSSQSVKTSDDSPTPDAETNAATEIVISPDLPVPTHIFRLSDNAPTRYLLCPHHCLLRLRAACQYWGFIRNLERSVVLEGKFVSDERLPPSVNASATDLVGGADEPKTNTVDTLEKAVVDAEKDAEEDDEAIAKENGVVDLPEIAEPAPEAQGEPDEGGAPTDDASADADASPAKEDANESDAAPDAAPATEQDETVKDENTETETSDGAHEAEPSAKTGEAESKTAPEPLAVPPPVPARSAARSSGRTSPAPTLPPRRPPRGSSSAEKALPKIVPAVRFGPPSVTSLQLSNLDAMEWEDKMWTEITKLKEDLWKARIGLLSDDAASH